MNNIEKYEGQVKGANALALEFITDNFTLFSAIISVLSTLSAGVFLLGYMSPFGVANLLIYEPADFLKFLIISGSVISVALIAVIFYVAQMEIYQNFLHVKILRLITKNPLYESELTENQIFIITNSCLLVGISAFEYLLIKMPDNEKHHFILISLIAVLGLTFWFNALIYCIIRKKSFKKGLIILSTFAIYLLFLTGNNTGQYVKKYSSKITVELTLGEHDRDIIRNAKLVMMLSHHLVLLVDNETTILPMNDVAKITKTIIK